VLFDHLCHDCTSLQFHSSMIYKETNISISKQAIDKRFSEKAVDFMKKVFDKYIKKKANTIDLDSELKSRFKSIRIMDSTEFKLHPSLSHVFLGYDGDGTKACAQLQFEFDMLTGNVKNISLDNVLVSDVEYGLKDMDKVEKDELLLRDLGYWNLNVYQKIANQDAFYISRLKNQISIFELKEGKFKPLTHKQIIKELNSSGKKYLDKTVYIGAKSKVKVRLLANLLDQKGIDRRIKRIKNRKSKLSDKDTISCQLNLFVTNIEDAVPADQIYNLYKLRWQVELVFKAWKSILKVHKFGKMKSNRLKCYLYAKMVWIMISWDIYQYSIENIWRSKNKLPSINKVYLHVKSMASDLRQLISKSLDSFKIWLKIIVNCIDKNALKDNKKSRLKLENILCMY
jgi:hypothetical protein